jgi:hypothetical protein
MKLTKLKALLIILAIVNLFSLIDSKRKAKRGRSHYELRKLRKFHNARNHVKALFQMKTKVGERQDDDIHDPVLVYSLSLAAHKKKDSSCPYPLELAGSNCEDHSCDLNEGKGGDYVYLCVGRKKLSQFTNEENIITTIRINKSTKDCGDLNLIDTRLKSTLIGGQEIYICYGYQEEMSPLSNVRIFNSYKGVLKDEKDVPDNCSISVSENKYLCVERESNGPKKIEYTNLMMGTSDDAFKPFGEPESITEIDNDNGSGKDNNTIKRQIFTTISKTASWNIEHKFGTKVNVDFAIKTPIINSAKFQVSAAFDMNWTRNKGEIVTDTEATQIDFSCMAPAKKYYKCKALLSKYEAKIPYKVTRKVTYYNESVEEKEITSFLKASTSSLKFERCCYKGCAETDKKCDLVAQPITNNCPSMEAATPADPTNIIDQERESVIAPLPAYNFNLITDIKLVFGSKSSIPSGFESAKCHALKASECKSSIGRPKVKIVYKKTELKSIRSPPINVIKISRNNLNCGSLNLIAKSINDNDLYLCFGNDNTSGLAPIEDIALIKANITPDFKDSKTISLVASEINKNFYNYDCDDILIGDFKLCYSRQTNAPKKVELKNFKYDFSKMKKVQVGPPKKVNEMIVSSGTASIMVKTTKKIETSFKKVFDFGSSVSVSFSGNIGIFSLNTGLNVSKRRSKSEEKKKSKETTESTTVECAAVENKVMKCVSSMIEYKVYLPYTADLIAYDYQDLELLEYNKTENEKNEDLTAPAQVSGVFEGVGSGNLITKSCCIQDSQNKTCCDGTETAEANKGRPHCVGSGKDTLCSELDTCFTPEQVVINAPEKQNRNALRKLNVRKYVNVETDV